MAKLKLSFSEFTEPVKPDHPRTLTYNGKMPDKHIIVTFVWHSAGDGILDDNYIGLTPCEATVDGIIEELEAHLEPVFDELPKKGVWRVVVSGKMDGCSYDTDYGREYDSWVDWEILSANKFPCFGSLKAWFKMWKAGQ